MGHSMWGEAQVGGGGEWETLVKVSSRQYISLLLKVIGRELGLLQGFKTSSKDSNYFEATQSWRLINHRHNTYDYIKVILTKLTDNVVWGWLPCRFMLNS